MQKKIKVLLSIFIIICILSLQCLPVYANILDMSISVRDDDEANDFWTNLKIRQIEETCIEPIKSFDVNEKGFIVILTNNNSVVVLNDKNEQLSAFSFKTYGNSFVKWNEDNVLLFLDRESIVIQMDMSGKLIKVIDVNKDDLNTSKKWRELRKEKSVSINGCEYSLQSSNNVISTMTSSYSQIIKTNSDGNCVAVYNASESYTLLSAFFCLFFCFIIILIIYFFIRIVKDNKGITNQGSQSCTGDGSVCSVD